MAERPVWLVGCGNMAGAMLTGWLTAGQPSSRFTAVSPSGRSFAGDVKVVRSLPDTPFGNSIVQLGFKPHMLGDLAPAIRQIAGPETTIVSILAGAELATLRTAFPEAGKIMRAIPNTPVALCKGAVGLLAENREGSDAAEVAKLMGQLGLAEWISDEELFDVVTALAGSGPAFLFRFIDALARGGSALGLDTDLAQRLAIATVQGAAELAARSEEDPGALTDRVASPGGSTGKGLDILDDDDALAELLAKTLAAATRRNREMAEEAKA